MKPTVKEKIFKFGFFLIVPSLILLIFMPLKNAVSMGFGIAIGQIFVDYIKEKR